MKTNTKLGSARPFWLPSLVNIDTLTNNLGFLYHHVMSKMTINKQNVHCTNVHFDQPAGLYRLHGTSESGRKNTLVGPVVLFNTLHSPRQDHHSGYGRSQFLAEVDDHNSIWYKSSSLSYAPESQLRALHWAPKV